MATSIEVVRMLDKIVKLLSINGNKSNHKLYRKFRAKSLLDAIEDFNVFKHPLFKVKLERCYYLWGSGNTKRFFYEELGKLASKIEDNEDISSRLLSSDLKVSIRALGELSEDDSYHSLIKDNCKFIHNIVLKDLVTLCLVKRDPQNHIGLKGRYVYILDENVTSGKPILVSLLSYNRELKRNTVLIDITGFVESVGSDIDYYKNYYWYRCAYGEINLKPALNGDDHYRAPFTRGLDFSDLNAAKMFAKNPDKSIYYSNSDAKDVVIAIKESLLTCDFEINDSYVCTSLKQPRDVLGNPRNRVTYALPIEACFGFDVVEYSSRYYYEVHKNIGSLFCTSYL